jgi:Tol biopolymer transport system component/tRNA A-37 threonylcarbamoyl transferase component Bud32
VALTLGTRVGAYEIAAQIGRGGMGEVYRARDTKLHREVAVKVLPDAFSRDPERLLRFEREARLLAALNHPNVAAIYGLEEQGGSRLLVMELVEGPTLAERLASGPLPIDEALSVCAGIASGLEAAHESGIIHRDLKPSNVKIRPDGTVKVLDLGLARVAEGSGVAVDSSLSPTVTTPATRAGVVLGTAAYMSPEQARGRTLDKRTDIFSFGCVLYECLAGRQAFFGETVSDTLAAIIMSEPDWSALPESTPRGVRDLLRRCLQKDPKRRLHDIADARIELEEAQAAPVSGPAISMVMRPSPGRLAWGVGGAVLGAVITATGLLLVRRPQPAPAPNRVRAVLPLPPGDRVGVGNPAVTVSPDGQTIVFQGIHQGSTALYRRALSGADAELIRGTEGGFSPFFSPDGQWIGFFTRRELKKVPLSGGTAVSLSWVPPVTRGGSWGEDSRIVITRKFNGQLDSIPESGGVLTPLARLDASRGERGHLFPQVLPGGRGILFSLRRGRDFSDAEASDVAVLDLPTGKKTKVLEGASFARYGAGRLVFVRGSSVFWVPFDVSRLSTTGPAVALSDGITVDGEERFGHFDVSPGGTLVFLEGPPSPTTTSMVLMLDRSGKESTLPLPSGNYVLPRFSPDGGRITLTRWEGVRGVIVTYERERNILSTLTPEPGTHFVPVWSPDGRRIAFTRFAEDMPVLSVKNADGSGEIEPLTEPGENDAEFPNSWSPDGKTILYTVAYTADRGPKRKLASSDLWLVSPGDRRSARLWFESPFRETGGAFSPDGRWIAYVSDESGVQEVYLRPYPGPGASIKVSNGFAIEPFWSRDGRELYFRTGERAEKLMAAEIRTAAGLSISPPRLLFTSELAVGGREDIYRQYDVSADGKEFVAVRYSRSEEPDRRLTIVTNWAATPGP